jgi:hypothetical protein
VIQEKHLSLCMLVLFIQLWGFTVAEKVCGTICIQLNVKLSIQFTVLSDLYRNCSKTFSSSDMCFNI